MAVDFQQVREQVRRMGETARNKQESLRQRRQQALALLRQHANHAEMLRNKVQELVSGYDSSLRCACPPDVAVSFAEPLDSAAPLPPLPTHATILAADGSQIPADHHAEVLYSLINVGAVEMHLGSVEAPQIIIQSQLKYDESLWTPFGLISEAMLALQRDQAERRILAELAQSAPPPVVAFTDGPIEIWGARDGDGVAYDAQLEAYLEALRNLHRLEATIAGYVDKPFANLVVRLLEVALIERKDYQSVRDFHPFRGVSDHLLFRELLGPGERSAVFALQSQSTSRYRGALALHFFYLNVGRPGHPWLARVEIPAWVAGDRQKLDQLHAILMDQCRMMGSRPFPYLLHRAHETAVVTFEERDQVTQMIALELRNQGLEVDEPSYKQSAKELEGRTRLA